MRDKKSPKPSAGTKKDGFSIANLISIFGLVALAFFLYLGFAYSGTNSGSAVLYSVMITIGIGLILYALLSAKKVENNFEKWRIVEYALLAVFVSACAATVPTLCHFINVNRDSDKLKYYALKDLDGMDQAIKAFKEQELSNLGLLKTSLQNVALYSNFHSATTDTLKAYISNEIFDGQDAELNNKNITSFTTKWEKHINNLHHNGEGNNYASTLKNAIRVNRNRIEAWSIFEIPQAIDEIAKLNEDLGKNLNSISASYPFYKIDQAGSQWDIVDKHTAFTTSIVSHCKEEYIKRTEVNLYGIALSILIFLLIIFNYVVAYRSTKVSVKAGSSSRDGGMILKA